MSYTTRTVRLWAIVAAVTSGCSASARPVGAPAHRPAESVARFSDPRHPVEIRSEYRNDEAYIVAFEQPPAPGDAIHPCGVLEIRIDDQPTLLTPAEGSGCVFAVPVATMHAATHAHSVEVRAPDWYVVATPDVLEQIRRIVHDRHRLVRESPAVAATAHDGTQP